MFGVEDIQGWRYTFFENPPGIFYFLLNLWTFQTLNPWIFHKIVLGLPAIKFRLI